MNRRLLLSGSIVLAVCIPFAAMAAPSAPPAAAAKAAEIGVDLLLDAPNSYPGKIVVRGAVRSVFAKEKKLGLMDVAYLSCCTSPCTTIPTLPVSWNGAMPSMRDLVLVTGEIRKTGEKLEFVASSLEKIPPADGAAK